MKKNYTLPEIKEELLKEISELEEMDPSWKNCRECPFHGRCCNGNDIDIREDEWEEIKTVLDRNPLIRGEVKQNFLSGKKCYFQSMTCCLINPVRPTNCLYTPYQAIQNLYDGNIAYSHRSKECLFTTKEIASKMLDPGKYLIRIEGEEHPYLLLNHWYLDYENQSEGTYKETGEERLKEYFSAK